MFFYFGMEMICFAATVISALFGFGYLIRRRKSAFSATLSVLLLCISFYSGLAAWRYDLSPQKLLAPSPWLSVLALSGVMVFRLFARMAELDTERRHAWWLPFALLVPAAASDIAVHGFSLQNHSQGYWASIIPALHALTGIGVIACCLAALVQVFRLYTFSTMSRLAWLVFAISGSGIVALLLGLSGMFIGNLRVYAVMDAFLAATVIVGALLSFRWPDVLDQFRSQTIARRYARSTLADCDVDGLITGMSEMVRATGLYLRRDCNLDELARRMGLTRHQVSELLNDRMGCNFADFINGFRIETAKELLVSQPDMTILAVALDAGFGNKTSFNDSFRRVVGCTPRQFREQGQ